MNALRIIEPWTKYETKKIPKADTLRAIGVGLPRTGTASLKAALDILGLGPCHHMLLFDSKKRFKEFLRAYNGEKVDFYELFKGFGSTLDIPTPDFYKQIHQAYPNAKIILTVRDNDEKWFESYHKTIRPMVENTHNNFYFSLLGVLNYALLVGQKSHERLLNKYGELRPEIHHKYNEELIKEFKDGEVLVFNVKQGWEPLCKFLQVDIPKGIPFPNVNDGEDFNHNVRCSQIFGTILWILLAVFGALFAYFVMGYI